MTGKMLIGIEELIISESPIAYWSMEIPTQRWQEPWPIHERSVLTWRRVCAGQPGDARGDQPYTHRSCLRLVVCSNG